MSFSNTLNMNLSRQNKTWFFTVAYILISLLVLLLIWQILNISVPKITR